MSIYYECHITIEPVFDALTEIKSIKQRMFKALDITVNRCTLVSKPYIYEVLK